MNFEGTFNNLVEKLTGWIEALILNLPNLAAAVVLVVVFWLVARLVRRLVGKGMDRVSSYHQLNRLLATTGYVLVLAAGVFVALGVLGLDKTVTSLLAGAGIIGLALAFAFQDIAGNFMSGILLALRRPFREGDIVETNDYFGTVQEVNLRSTHIRSPQGQLIIIPNSSVFQEPLKNYSKLGMRRVDLSCGVAYGDDLDKAERVACAAIEAVDYRDTSREVELFYNEFGGSSVNFIVCFWIDFSTQADFMKAQSDAIKRLKAAFDENDITIPFPITTLDFGVVGGERLDEVLPQRFYKGNGVRTPTGAS